MTNVFSAMSNPENYLYGLGGNTGQSYAGYNYNNTVTDPDPNKLQAPTVDFGVLGANDVPLQIAPNPTGPTGGDGSGSGSTEPAIDWGAKVNTTFSTAAGSARDNKTGLNNSANRLVTDYQTGQRGVDNSRINNYMAKEQGRLDIMDMVGRGIQSGGVMLAGRNAAQSSAAPALARAYGQIGEGQLKGIGNQFAQAQLGAQETQQDLNSQWRLGKDELKDEVTLTVNDIVNEAEVALTTLDDMMVEAGVLDRIDIQAEKERIKAKVNDILGGINTDLTTRGSQVQAMAPGDIQAEAARRMSLGQPTANPFDYSTSAPVAMQGGQAPAGGILPIYTGRRREE